MQWGGGVGGGEVCVNIYPPLINTLNQTSMYNSHLYVANLTIGYPSYKAMHYCMRGNPSQKVRLFIPQVLPYEWRIIVFQTVARPFVILTFPKFANII